jgi:hypothetical protein
VDHARQVGPGDREVDRAAVEVGDRQDLLDQAGQAVDGVVHLRQELHLVLGRQALVLQQVRDALHDGDGRPQLMGDVRQEFSLGVGDLLDLHRGVGQGPSELALAVDPLGEPVEQRTRDPRRDDAAAVEDRAQGSDHLGRAVLLQQVAHGAGADDLGRVLGGRRPRPTDDGRRRRHRAQALDEVGPPQAGHDGVGDDGVGPGADRELDRVVPVGRGLRQGIPAGPGQRVLQHCHVRRRA